MRDLARAAIAAGGRNGRADCVGETAGCYVSEGAFCRRAVRMLSRGSISVRVEEVIATQGCVRDVGIDAPPFEPVQHGRSRLGVRSVGVMTLVDPAAAQRISLGGAHRAQ